MVIQNALKIMSIRLMRITLSTMNKENQAQPDLAPCHAPPWEKNHRPHYRRQTGPHPQPSIIRQTFILNDLDSMSKKLRPLSFELSMAYFYLQPSSICSLSILIHKKRIPSWQNRLSILYFIPRDHAHSECPPSSQILK